MATKETIALVGNANEICAELVHKLAGECYRLLLITEDDHQLRGVVDQVQEQWSDAEIEIIHCVKEGCWEADIIVLLGEVDYEGIFINRIREVSTQKIVVGISVKNFNAKASSVETGDLKSLLPHSKIVQLIYNSELTTAFIGGEDAEALNTIAALVKKLGYNTEKVITI